MPITKTKPFSEFEAHRAKLWNLAYRLLGLAHEADDVVQDVYIKWHREPSSIQSHGAWLTSVCTRHCIDLMRSSAKTRMDYVGVWLPEPVSFGYDQEDPVHISQAFLLLLERLNPEQRAAYVLRELFDSDYKEIASILGKAESAVRQLVSRAKTKVSQRNGAGETPVSPGLTQSFLEALKSGDLTRLKTLFARDVELYSDGGGVVSAVGRVITDRAHVLRIMIKFYQKFWCHLDAHFVRANGTPAIYLAGPEPSLFTFELAAGGRISKMLITRNPQKMGRLIE